MKVSEAAEEFVRTLAGARKVRWPAREPHEITAPRRVHPEDVLIYRTKDGPRIAILDHRRCRQ